MTTAQKAGNKPNIFFIMGEDVGKLAPTIAE
jgi:hypothetical protein